MLPIPEYWRAVAQAIDAEDVQASIFIKHNSSVGAAREAILNEVLSRQTLEPYRVTSGFVFHAPSEQWCSRQCDVIVYNPMVARPCHSIGDLTVVPREAASLVVEIKTYLDRAAFGDMFGIWESVFWLPVPMLGFAYDGVRFQTGRLGYAALAGQNVPIGSGVTEAACKVLVKQRLCGSGMRWKESGAAAVLSVRCLTYTAGRWSQFRGRIDRDGFPVAA